jgi:hypothetical protein
MHHDRTCSSVQAPPPTTAWLPCGLAAEFSWLHVERVWPHGAARPLHGKAGAAVGSATAFAADEAQLKPLRAKRLVVSLASFPGRAEYAAPTVYSIMHGTRKPDTLYFWVTVNVSRWACRLR